MKRAKRLSEIRKELRKAEATVKRLERVFWRAYWSNEDALARRPGRTVVTLAMANPPLKHRTKRRRAA
jgi:hypothetical protein